MFFILQLCIRMFTEIRFCLKLKLTIHTCHRKSFQTVVGPNHKIFWLFYHKVYYMVIKLQGRGTSRPSFGHKILMPAFYDYLCLCLRSRSYKHLSWVDNFELIYIIIKFFLVKEKVAHNFNKIKNYRKRTTKFTSFDAIIPFSSGCVLFFDLISL